MSFVVCPPRRCNKNEAPDAARFTPSLMRFARPAFSSLDDTSLGGICESPASRLSSEVREGDVFTFVDVGKNKGMAMVAIATHNANSVGSHAPCFSISSDVRIVARRRTPSDTATKKENADALKVL